MHVECFPCGNHRAIVHTSDTSLAHHPEKNCDTAVFQSLCWIMWRKAALVALLALTAGYIYHTNPELPERMLQFVTQSLPQSLPSVQNEPGVPTLEEAISRAWNTLITAPSKHWGRIAVGWVSGTWWIWVLFVKSIKWVLKQRVCLTVLCTC